MGNLIPGEKIISYHKDGTIWSYYPNRPDIDPWVTGYTEPEIFTYSVWLDMTKKAKSNKMLEQYINKAINIYLMIKDDKEE